MLYLLLIIMISSCFLSITILYKKHDFTSPLFITNSIWIGIAIVGIFVHHLFFEFSTKIFLIWLSWSLTLNITLLLMSSKNRKQTNRVYTVTLPNYWPYLLALSAYMLYEVIKLGLNGPHPFLLNIRLANIMGYPSPIFSIFSRMYPLFFTLFLFEITLNNNKKNRYSTYLYMMIFVLYSAGKMAILTPIICYVAIRARRGEINFIKLIPLFFIILIAMLILHYLRKSHGDITPLLQTLATYTYSPIIALGEVEPSSSLHWGENTFRLLYALSYAFGISDIEPINLILNYSHIPTPTNVYTAIYIFYKDFGQLGVIWGAFIYGIIYSILYNSFIKQKTISSIIYLSALTPITLSFFSETLISLLSTYIQILFYTFLIGLLYERRKNRYSTRLLQWRKLHSQSNIISTTANSY
ncbi:MAG: oligosaccharide repeat unit polymerase [Xanthomonadaceae bacterium]|nr:oligosaccharide repeat unit polymerase [Xanthomonadaceae bacterium]